VVGIFLESTDEFLFGMLLDTDKMIFLKVRVWRGNSILSTPTLNSTPLLLDKQTH